MGNNVYWGLYSLRSSGDTTKGPTLLLVGDSWFWYPFNNLATEIAAKLKDEHVLLVLGDNGAEAQEYFTKYKKGIALAFEWYAAGCQALLISGGGNDIAGTADFRPILQDDCSSATTVAECYHPGQPDYIMDKIKDAYRDLIREFRKYNPAAPVICHNYEKAWPTGAGVFGPADWLKVPMDGALVPEALRHDLFVDLLTQLNAIQTELSDPAEGLGQVVAIESTGTLPDTADIWANELHLKPAAFRKMVKLAWKPVLNEVGIA